MKNKKNILAVFGVVLLTMASNAQVPSYVPTNGLKVWYAFNGNSNDGSGQGNNAVNTAVTFVPDRYGAPNSAGSFNGTNSSFIVNTPSFSLGQMDAFTFSVWIYKQTQPLAGIVMMTGSGASGNFVTIIQGSTSEVFGTNIQGSSWVYIYAPHTLNVWDNYVATYNNGLMKFYKNGVLQSSGTNTYNAATANLPLYIGRGISTGYFFGYIDDVGIWQRELSQSEITALYNSVTTSVDDNKTEPELNLLYNTLAETLQVKTDNLSLGSGYYVFDEMGRKVLEGNIAAMENNIDVSRLPVGIYYFTIDTPKRESAKFIKK